jgi:hypothetical protein
MRCIKYLIGACTDDNQHEMAFLLKFCRRGGGKNINIFMWLSKPFADFTFVKSIV